MLHSEKLRERFRSRFSSLRSPIRKINKSDEEQSSLDDYKTKRELSNTSRAASPSIKLGEKEKYHLPSSYIFSNKSDNISTGKTGHINISFLKTGSLPSSSHEKRFNITVFNIQKNPQPYIRYLMYKYSQASESGVEVIIPYFYAMYNDQDPKEIAEKKLTQVFKDWDSEIQYHGYTETQDDVYLVFESKFNQDFLFNQKRNDVWWWCLIDEIINVKSVLNFPVSESATNFFIKNPQLGILFDDKDMKLEVPKVAFYGGYHKTIAFISVFGLNRAPVNASMGPFYYFAGYKRAGRYALWTNQFNKDNPEIKTVDDNGLYDRGGIVRFAIFLGKTKMFLNRENDPDDQSEKNRDNEYITKTIKLRDADGKWTSNNNSVFVSSNEFNIGGDNRTILHQFVVKDYTQQTPLSYHYVDTGQAANINLNDLENYFIE